MKKILLWSSAILVAIVVVSGVLLGPTLKRFLLIQTLSVDPTLTVYLGGGGNSVVLKSEDGKQALVVDTKVNGGAKKLQKDIAALGPDVRVLVVNTHCHTDHTGGNKLFPKACLIAGAYDDALWKSQAGGKTPDEKNLPGQEKTLTIGKETVRIYNVGQAHTTNDMVVYLVNHKMLVTGDLVFNGWHPVLKKDSGTNVGLWIKALEDVASRYDAATVVPGHGPLGDKQILKAERDYFQDIEAAVGKKEQLQQLREKYRDYFSLFRGMSSFDKTVAFIAAEKARQGK